MNWACRLPLNGEEKKAVPSAFGLSRLPDAAPVHPRRAPNSVLQPRNGMVREIRNYVPTTPLPTPARVTQRVWGPARSAEEWPSPCSTNMAPGEAFWIFRCPARLKTLGPRRGTPFCVQALPLMVPAALWVQFHASDCHAPHDWPFGRRGRHTRGVAGRRLPPLCTAHYARDSRPFTGYRPSIRPFGGRFFFLDRWNRSGLQNLRYTHLAP